MASVFYRTSRKTPIEKLLLFTVAGVGILTAAALSPALGILLKEYGLKQKLYPHKYTSNALFRLKHKGLIRFEERKGKRFFALTEKGQARLNRYRREDLAYAEKPPRWDGKWRIVIFDIQETHRAIRNHIRGELAHIGFVKLQNSVWVYPYDCEEFIVLLKADYRIGKRLLFIVAEKVEYDKPLRGIFRLD